MCRFFVYTSKISFPRHGLHHDMTRKYVYADEAGDFEFARKPNVSKYYIICTVLLSDPTYGHQLLDLRRDLIWKGDQVDDYFHATKDKQSVRDAVFDLIQKAPIQIGATILEKSKAQTQIRHTNVRFYKYGWYFHLSGVASKIAANGDEILFTTASIGTKKGQATFTAAVNDVVQQKIQRCAYKTHFCPSMADPCLQIADYCTWAIQRKWERGDDRSYKLIEHLVHHEHDTWARGVTHYY
jgi:hypothetical protein